MSSATSVAFSPDGHGSRRGGKRFGEVRGLDIKQGARAARRGVSACTPPASRSRMAARCWPWAGTKGSLSLWHWPTRRKLAVLSGHRGGVNSIDFSADDSVLASADTEGLVKLWSVTERQRTTDLPCARARPRGHRGEHSHRTELCLRPRATWSAMSGSGPRLAVKAAAACPAPSWAVGHLRSHPTEQFWPWPGLTGPPCSGPLRKSGRLLLWWRMSAACNRLPSRATAGTSPPAAPTAVCGSGMWPQPSPACLRQQIDRPRA